MKYWKLLVQNTENKTDLLIKFSNTNVVVSFNPYLIPNQKDKIDT